MTVRGTVPIACIVTAAYSGGQGGDRAPTFLQRRILSWSPPLFRIVRFRPALATRHAVRTMRASVTFVTFAYPSIDPPSDALTSPPSTVIVSPTT